MLILVGALIAIVAGGGCLATAAQYEPTFENALFSGGDVLDPESHAVLQAGGAVLLVIGLGGLVGGVLLLTIGAGRTTPAAAPPRGS